MKNKNFSKIKKARFPYFSAFLQETPSFNFSNLRKNFLFSIKRTECCAVLRNKVKRRFRAILIEFLKDDSLDFFFKSGVEKKIRFLLTKKSLDFDFQSIKKDFKNSILYLLK